MWDVSVLADSGREWRLTGDSQSRVAIKAGGMSGMVAKGSETGVSVAGRPGVRTVASRVDSLAPSWDLVFIDRDGSGLGEDVADWLSAWREGVTVTVESSFGRLSTRGRVPPDADEVFDVIPFASRVRWGQLDMPWAWVADRPVWELLQSFTGAGDAAISNFGDVPVVPVVSWSGAGKWIAINGGGLRDLPEVAGRARMVLDHAENCVVTDESGVRLDAASAWSRQNALNLSMVVQPGKSEVITVLDGVDVVWTVGVKSPWR